MVMLLAKKKAKPTPFGLKLKELRLAAGLTQKLLADAVGLQQPQVAAFENSPSANPTISTVQKLAAAIGCKVADLIPDAQEPPP